MVSFVFCLWALLTTAIAVVWSVSLLHPVWVIHPDNVHSFGLQKYCVMDLRGTTGGSQREALHRACLPYGRELRIGNIPSDTWRAAFLLFSSGTLLFIASVLSGLLSVVIQGKWDRYVSMTTKYIQITAGKEWNKILLKCNRHVWNLLLVLVFDINIRLRLCLYLPYTLYTKFSSCRKCLRM